MLLTPAELRREFFRYGLMDAVRNDRGEKFRLPFPHRPTPIEVSQQLFDRKPPVYDPYDVIEFRLVSNWYCGQLYMAVAAYPPYQETCLIIEPFHIPEARKELIPLFPEEL